jgi:predicted MPP superfamily phosphohydrolase
MMRRRRRAAARPRKRGKWLLALAVFAAVVAAVAVYSYTETYRLEVKEYTFSSPDVPAAFDGVQVALVTDIHRSFYFSEKRLAGVVDQVNALHPDLILLGGDYVNGSKGYEASAFAELARLKAPLGTFAVLGNHDYAHPGGDVNDPAPAVAAAQKAGIPLFDNAGAWVEKSGARLRVAGVSDLQQSYPNAAEALGGAGASDLVLLLSHEPDYAEKLEPGQVDLVLSGHTHGGQMTFFGLWAPFVASEYGQKYRTGVVDNGRTTVIVSEGVGTIFPPLRFFARPQIVVVTLERAE